MFRIDRLLCTLAIALAALTVPSYACSVCSCGDPSTVACSREVVEESPHWAVALESRYFSKQNSNDAGDGTESHSQTQVGLAVSRTFEHGLEVYGRIPYVATLLKTTGSSDEAGRITKNGAGDADLLAKYSRRTTSPWTPSISLGTKVPTGNNDLRENGERITEHAQPGTGSWDGYAVLTLTREGEILWSGSAGYRFNGVNTFQQRYGQVGWLQMTGSSDVASWLWIDTGLRLRTAAHDRTGDGIDPNSGGTLFSALVGARFGVTRNVALRISGSVPLANDLGGTQKEFPQIEGGFVMTF